MDMVNYFVSFWLMLILSIMFFLMGFYFVLMDFKIFLDWEFLSLGGCEMSLTFYFDWLALIFVGSVLLISSMVIFYSESYMSWDINIIRFYYLVMMFVFSMLLMIVSPNMISILIGWDGLGLVSYCLVIYFQSFSAHAAGALTILMNRLGDVAILLSVVWMVNFGSWHFLFYFSVVEIWAFLLIFFVIVAGFTKSAQIPFSSWLPAAMAAPTPVSSLVHSSTLVTAGVYLLIRFSDFLIYFDMKLLIMFSVLTMFMSGLSANFELDMSKIIALSTLSQLGLMMFILFLGFSGLAFFHLIVHAFFKALMFLCSGLIIHCMSDGQDIRFMGGVSNQMPFTCACFCVSNMALCGMPFMSGFYSKDFILEMMIFSGNNVFIVLIFLISIGLTVSYSVRLIYCCFSFNMNVYVCQNYFENLNMNMSLIFLTILSILGGSILGWLIFKVPVSIFLSLDLSLIGFVFILLGGWLGYELSNSSLFSSSYWLWNYLFIYCHGCMWFLNNISTYVIYSELLKLSESSISLMDGGWGEYKVSQSLGFMGILMSKMYAGLQYNSLKLFMIFFVIMILIFSI